MKYLIGFLLGMTVVWLWPRLRKHFGDASAPQGGETPSPVPLISVPAPAVGTPAVETNAEQESLTSRLTALFSAVDAEVNTSASARELANHPKFVEARRLLADKNVPIETVRDYAMGSNWFYSCTALAALYDRDDRDDALEHISAFFDTLTPWAMTFALKFFTVAEPRPPVGAPLLAAREYWRDNMFAITALREYLDERSRLGDDPAFGPALEGTTPEQREVIKGVLGRISHPLATELIETLETARLTNVDRTFLNSFGRFWQFKASDVLVEPEFWTDALSEAEANVLGRASALAAGRAARCASARPRSCGCSARRLEQRGLDRLRSQRRRPDGGAAVVRPARGAHPAHHRGAGRLQEAHLVHPRHSADRAQRHASGPGREHPRPDPSRHRGRPPDRVDRGLGGGHARASCGCGRLLRGIFEVVRLEPMEPEETDELARDVARAITAAKRRQDRCRLRRRRAHLGAPVSQRLEPSRRRPRSPQADASGARPRAAAPPSTPHDVIETLSQLTGLPASILDSNERVDLAAVRSYFSARVIGQDEAVGAIVERIAMLKAGLNDPGKPIGVFLFAGPDRHRQDRARQDARRVPVRLESSA